MEAAAKGRHAAMEVVFLHARPAARGSAVGMITAAAEAARIRALGTRLAAGVCVRGAQEIAPGNVPGKATAVAGRVPIHALWTKAAAGEFAPRIARQTVRENAQGRTTGVKGSVPILAVKTRRAPAVSASAMRVVPGSVQERRMGVGALVQIRVRTAKHVLAESVKISAIRSARERAAERTAAGVNVLRDAGRTRHAKKGRVSVSRTAQRSAAELMTAAAASV